MMKTERMGHCAIPRMFLLYFKLLINQLANSYGGPVISVSSDGKELHPPQTLPCSKCETEGFHANPNPLTFQETQENCTPSLKTHVGLIAANVDKGPSTSVDRGRKMAGSEWAQS